MEIIERCNSQLYLFSNIAFHGNSDLLHRHRLWWNTAVQFQLEFRRRIDRDRILYKSHLCDSGNLHGNSYCERQRVATTDGHFSPIGHCHQPASSGSDS